MTKITCDIVKDLIPLYVDDVLSGDSKMLVDEHMQSCEKCCNYYKTLSEGTGYTPAKVEKEKAVIKRIKKKINYKRMITACISAIVVAAFSLLLFYVFFVREQYVTYEDSGIYMENGSIKTKNEYQCFYGFEDPDDKSVFYMYLSATPYHKHQQKDAPIEMFHISDADNTIKTIYYIPEDYVDAFRDYQNGLTDEKQEELQKVAPIFWSEN